MYRTLYGWPNNHSKYQGAVRNSTQSETTKFIHNGIHLSIQNPTSKFIKTGKICINIPHSPLKSHLNWKIVWWWMHCHVWQTQSHSKKTQYKYYWRLSVSNEHIMALHITWYIPRQPTIQHNITQSKKTLKKIKL